jgi:hypothetical protein
MIQTQLCVRGTYRHSHQRPADPDRDVLILVPAIFVAWDRFRIIYVANDREEK